MPMSAGKIPEKNIKHQFRMITGIIILHGILSRRMEMSGRIIQPHIIYSYSAVLCFFLVLWVYDARFYVPDASNIT